MEDLIKMIITVVSGVLVFVLSQLFIEYFFKPIQEYKKLKSHVAYVLTYYACYYSNPVNIDNDKNGLWKNASIELRKVAAEVDAFSQIKPAFMLPCLIPIKNNLIDVSKSLIGLSNNCITNSICLKDHYFIEEKQNIERLLRLK